MNIVLSYIRNAFFQLCIQNQKTLMEIMIINYLPSEGILDESHGHPFHTCVVLSAVFTFLIASSKFSSSSGVPFSFFRIPIRTGTNQQTVALFFSCLFPQQHNQPCQILKAAASWNLRNRAQHHSFKSYKKWFLHHPTPRKRSKTKAQNVIL